MLVEDLEGLRGEPGRLTEPEFAAACEALRAGMGALDVGERPPREVLAMRRAPLLQGEGGHGHEPSPRGAGTGAAASDDQDNGREPEQGPAEEGPQRDALAAPAGPAGPSVLDVEGGHTGGAADPTPGPRVAQALGDAPRATGVTPPPPPPGAGAYRSSC